MDLLTLGLLGAGEEYGLGSLEELYEFL